MKHIKTYENNIKYNIADLMLAVKENDLDKVKKIVNSGFDINTKTFKDKNIVNYISLESKINYNIIEYIIKSGANVNCIDGHGDIPLTFVAYKPTDMTLLNLLIEYDADWNFKDADGNDFLEYLQSWDKKEIIQKYPEKYKDYLMKKDANNYNL